jgi:phosphatidylinositol glycan class B
MTLTIHTQNSLYRGQNPRTYRDQSDFFYQDPLRYLATRFPPHVDPAFPPSPVVVAEGVARGVDDDDYDDDLGWTHEWPSHLVVFQALLDNYGGGVRDFLEAKGYVEEHRLWNSHWHEDERRRGDVVVLRWTRTDT